MLISIDGAIGSGKTTLLTLISTKSKRKVYSNYEIKIDLYESLQVIDLLNLPNNINVFIDEAYTWLESRTSSSTLNRYLTYIIFQSRKRNIDIYITTQMFSSVDIRFREQSNIIIKCKRIRDNFHYWFYYIGSNIIRTFILPLKKAEKYFKLFDTYEIVEPNQKSNLEFKIIEQNPKHMIEKASEIAEYIRPKLKKITHDSIKYILLTEGYPISYEKYIYIYLKEIDLE